MVPEFVFAELLLKNALEHVCELLTTFFTWVLDV